MIFADKYFYKDEYLLGRTEVILLSEFDFWSRKASQAINKNKIVLNSVPEYLKMCTCEVAELYYTEDENSKSDNIKSETVSGHSVTYADQRQGVRLGASVNKVILRWLDNTELHNKFIYRGV